MMCRFGLRTGHLFPGRCDKRQKGICIKSLIKIDYDRDYDAYTITFEVYHDKTEPNIARKHVRQSQFPRAEPIVGRSL